jgi:rare lipoprotein A
MRRIALLSLCAALLLAGCGKKKQRIPTPPPPSSASGRAPSGGRAPAQPAVEAPPPGTTERGVASWYGKPYDGRAAADGEIYDMETLVAAHRTLPFQTMVRVRNLSNDKTVDVRIIDRGPFVGGRIIDLSHAAARAIDLIGPGFGPVELTILSSATPESPAPPQFGVQVGAFRDKGNADRMQQRMIAAYGAGREVLRQADPPVWRVLAGAEATPEAAETLAAKIRAEQSVPEAFVVRLDPQ